ncbi:MAG: hypothetical protein L6R36_009507, partial [Xanthoria steineri]
GSNVPTPASIEAGEIQIQDHLSYFSNHLARAVRPENPGPRLSTPDFVTLYQRNYHPQGRHFVVHQHDHPIAGVHYDLRLQISETSSISFAIMYGLPGNPNSRRLNRNATETRVHCLWNHLIETASTSTGSLLIWDTGEYTILPYHSDQTSQTDTESSHSSSSESHQPSTTSNESSKLHQAFQNRKIRLRLHGTRLPPNYTLSLRLLPSHNRHSQSSPPARRKRRRDDPGLRDHHHHERENTPSSSDEQGVELDEYSNDTTNPPRAQPERPCEDNSEAQIRLSNAYPGATNSIHSIHQRK